jgi:prepilin-type N-terminal cleavage/methylation domain-containing protein
VARPNDAIAREAGTSQAGMSLVEMLIGVALLAVIAVGILPLFASAIRQNREGGKYTDLSNVARSTLEEYQRFDFNAPQMTVPSGATSISIDQYWNASARRWAVLSDPANPPAGALWQRTVIVQQFTSGDLLDNGRLDTPLDGNVSAGSVQLKLVRVVVRPLWNQQRLLGVPTPITMQLIKAV